MRLPDEQPVSQTEYRNRLASYLRAARSFAVPVLVALIAWEILSRCEFVNPRLFPPPTQVWHGLYEWYASGEFWRDVKASYCRMLAGLLAGGFAGIVLGMLTGRNKRVSAGLVPLIQLLRPLPPVAIIPLVIVWLGIGNTAKIFSIAFAVFFPVWLNTHLGALTIPEPYLRSARLLCQSRLRMVFTILVPAALPLIIAGLRTSISIAFIMVYVSEIAGASAGIGYQISICHLAYRIDKMVAALAVLAAAGAFADFVFVAFLRHVFPWISKTTRK